MLLTAVDVDAAVELLTMTNRMRSVRFHSMVERTTSFGRNLVDTIHCKLPRSWRQTTHLLFSSYSLMAIVCHSLRRYRSRESMESMKQSTTTMECYNNRCCSEDRMNCQRSQCTLYVYIYINYIKLRLKTFLHSFHSFIDVDNLQFCS